MKLLIPALIAAACAGCASSIQVQRLNPDPQTSEVLTGVPWNLAMTQFNVMITRQVTGCSGKLNGTASVTAVASKRLDEDQQYALSSKGVWATADITSTLATDGTSLTLNGHSEDQTGAVISNTVGFLTAVATAAPMLAAGVQMQCSNSVTQALANLKGDGKTSLKKKVDQDTKLVASLTAKVAQLTTMYTASKAESDGVALTKAMAQLDEAQRAQTDDQALLAASLKALTDTQTFVWPPNAKESATASPFELDQGVAQSWVKWIGLPAGAAIPPVPADAFKVWLGLYRTDGFGGWALPSKVPTVGDTTVGVPVRLPRVGRLLACTGQACASTLSRNWVADDNNTQLITPDPSVLQFGQLYNVPITGGTFKSEGAVITLDANGIPTSIQVYEKVAAAVAATASAQSVATSISELPGKIVAAKLAKTQAELSQVKATNDLAAAQASSSTAGETAAVNARLSYINAQNSLIQAQANAQSAGDVGAVAAQLALVQQQLALQDKQNALGTSTANASVASAIDTLQANTTLLNAKATNINARVALAKAESALKP
jgi:hypothetical protein